MQQKMRAEKSRKWGNPCIMRYLIILCPDVFFDLEESFRVNIYMVVEVYLVTFVIVPMWQSRAEKNVKWGNPWSDILLYLHCAHCKSVVTGEEQVGPCSLTQRMHWSGTCGSMLIGTKDAPAEQQVVILFKGSQHSPDPWHAQSIAWLLQLWVPN